MHSVLEVRQRSRAGQPRSEVARGLARTASKGASAQIQRNRREEKGKGAGGGEEMGERRARSRGERESLDRLPSDVAGGHLLRGDRHVPQSDDAFTACLDAAARLS